MKLTLNLATRPYVNRSLLYATYTGLLAILVLVALLNLFNYLRSREEKVRLQQHISDLQRRTAPLPGSEAYSAQKHELLNQRILFANKVLELDSQRPSTLFDRLEEMMIDGVRLGALQPDIKVRSLRISGNAEDVETLRRFLDRLISSRGYAEVYLLQQTPKGEVPGAEGIDFSIELKEADRT